jgi:hypothetical protein
MKNYVLEVGLYFSYKAKKGIAEKTYILGTLVELV